MRCYNCGKKIPASAKVCSFCEAAVEEEPTEEETQAVMQMLAEMPPDALQELQAAFANSDTAEEFVNRIFVGDCPKCGSSETDHCENDPEIDNLLVGRCFKCGQLWCTECLKLLTPEVPVCDCLDEEDCDEV